MFKFLKHINAVMKFMGKPREERTIVFYSENKNYWPHLEKLVKEVIADGSHVCYVTSSDDDGGLDFEDPKYSTFIIGDGLVRNWFFENMETNVVVLTMPDLNIYQLKRSKHKVHYIYVQHSLVSLHMVYRKHAFDCYDSIFCAGPHHVKEVRAMENLYGSQVKNIVEHGYCYLETMTEEYKTMNVQNKSSESPKHILIAPSWGPNGLVETVGKAVVDNLIEHGYKVTLRPHPQTIKFSKDKVDLIVNKYKKNPLFVYESSIVGKDSLYNSDLLISDWSGAAIEYALALKKPVLYVDVPRKINNPDYEELGIVPLEESIRNEIGIVVGAKNIGNLNEYVEKCFKTESDFNRDDYCFSPVYGKAVEYIKSKINN